MTVYWHVDVAQHGAQAVPLVFMRLLVEGQV